MQAASASSFPLPNPQPFDRDAQSRPAREERPASESEAKPHGNAFGSMLVAARGSESRSSFARRLKLSYTFVRAMESGARFPSDDVLLEIARQLHLDPEELLLAAHCDRSPALARALERRGLRPVIPAPPEPSSQERPLDREAGDE